MQNHVTFQQEVAARADIRSRSSTNMNIAPAVPIAGATETSVRTATIFTNADRRGANRGARDRGPNAGEQMGNREGEQQPRGGEHWRDDVDMGSSGSANGLQSRGPPSLQRTQCQRGPFDPLPQTGSQHIPTVFQTLGSGSGGQAQEVNGLSMAQESLNASRQRDTLQLHQKGIVSPSDLRQVFQRKCGPAESLDKMLERHLLLGGKHSEASSTASASGITRA
ncbi:unnamed protein product, partial [Amoebophrya sp. A25]|eukprot:GSA25T00027123001.1